MAPQHHLREIAEFLPYAPFWIMWPLAMLLSLSGSLIPPFVWEYIHVYPGRASSICIIYFSLFQGVYWCLGRKPLTQQRKDAGLCPKCGYDLRATPEYCPECGTMAERED